MRAAIGPAMKATNAIGPVAAVAKASSATAATIAITRVLCRRTPRLAAASSPRRITFRSRALDSSSRHEEEARQRERQHLRPRGPVEAAGEPPHGGLQIVRGGLREDVRHDGIQHGRHADADEDQTGAGEAALVGEQVDREGGEQAAGDREDRDGGVVQRQDDDAEHRGGARARGDADDVGRRERVAQHRLEGDAGDAEGGSREDRQHRTRQAQLADRERGAGHRLSEDDAHDVVEAVEGLPDHQRACEDEDHSDGERDRHRGASTRAAPAAGDDGLRRPGERACVLAGLVLAV